jgi:hypothetical protein
MKFALLLALITASALAGECKRHENPRHTEYTGRLGLSKVNYYDYDYKENGETIETYSSYGNCIRANATCVFKGEFESKPTYSNHAGTYQSFKTTDAHYIGFKDGTKVKNVIYSTGFLCKINLGIMSLRY